MAKKQNFIVGSTNPNTNTWTTSELNNGWDRYQVLKSGDLDGVFKAVSDYSNDSSQEIWNAIRILKGSNPTGASTSELGNIISTLLAEKASKATDFITPITTTNKGATETELNKLREEIETSSLTFKGYVATSEPSSSTYGLVEGNIWINASAMPTTFPVAIAGVWNGTAWATTTETYTAKDFDFFRNINDGEGYYWFGGQWVVMSTDMSTDYFTLNQTSGKWEIKSSVNLPGSPTTTTPAAADDSTKIATTAWVRANMPSVSQVVPTGAIMPYVGSTAPSGYLMCNGQAVSRTTYSALFSVCGTQYGEGDGSTTFNLPDYTDRVAQGLGTGYLTAGLPSLRLSTNTTGAHTHERGTMDITGSISGLGGGTYGASGAFTSSSSDSSGYGDIWGTNAFNFSFKASRNWSGATSSDGDHSHTVSSSNPIYGGSTTVQPPATKTYWIVKY